MGFSPQLSPNRMHGFLIGFSSLVILRLLARSNESGERLRFNAPVESSIPTKIAFLFRVNSQGG